MRTILVHQQFEILLRFFFLSHMFKTHKQETRRRNISMKSATANVRYSNRALAKF